MSCLFWAHVTGFGLLAVLGGKLSKARPGARQPVRAIHDCAGFSPGELSGRNYPNRTGRFWVFWKTPYQIARRQKSTRPDCRAPGPGKKSPVRAITVRHSPAAICDVFRGHLNKAPPENTHDYHRRHEAGSFEFFYARPGPDLEREEREGLGRVANSPPS